MAERDRPTLTGARVIATGEGDAAIARIGPTNVEKSDFIFGNGERVYVDVGAFARSGPGTSPVLVVKYGKRYPGGEPVRDEDFTLPEYITVEGGDLRPSAGLRSTEGHRRYREPGKILNWIAGREDLD
jgi:hypothetical protein